MNKKNIRLKLIYYLSLIGFFAIFSTTISKNPVLPLYAKSLGSNETIIGLIAAISPLAGIIFSLPIGIFSDKIGRKKLLVIAGFVFLISPLLYLAISNPLHLIPIRFFHGIATAILGPVASAIIVERYAASKGEKLGIYSSATLIGRTIAPFIGGFIISYFAMLQNSLNYKLVYVAAFIFALPVFILIFFVKEEKKTAAVREAGLSGLAQSFLYVFKEKRLLATALVEMATYFAFGALETYLPLYLQSKNIPVYQIGLIFSIQILSIAASKPFFGRIADRFDKRLQILIGILTLGVSLALLPYFSSIYSIILIGIIFGLGMSFSTIATSAYTGDIAKKDRIGTSMGALSSIMDIGHSAGPFITGIIISRYSYSAGFAGSLILSIATAVFFIFSAYRK